MNAIEEAEAHCKKAGFDFWANVHLVARSRGHVLLSPWYACIAWQLTPEDLFIWLACGRGFLHKLVALAPETTKRVQWARTLKGRPETKSYSFERIKALCHVRLSQTSPDPTPAAGGYRN